MNQKNKYGLSRNIDEKIKLQIRKECGFGCVICGMTIYQYEHIDPEFSEAKEHNPKNMALLCGSCHLKVTKKLWSKDKIKKARVNPVCLQKGYSNDFFDVNEPFGVSVGRIYFTKNKSGDLLIINDQKVLSMKKIQGEPPLLSGIFCNKRGEKIFEIKDNEWIGNIKAWDIESVANRLIIKDQENSVLLKINARPPHIIAVEHIDLVYGDKHLLSDETSGRLLIQSDKIKHIDASSGNIIAEGPFVINNDNFQILNGSILMIAQEGVTKLNSLDFDRFILKGEIVSTTAQG